MSEPGRLVGKSALVTGAGSGIGRAIALLFASEGAAVMATDVDEASASHTTGEILGRGFRSETMYLDVTSEEQARDGVRATLDAFGALDLLVNVAGIGSTQTVPDTDLNTWNRVFAVNVTGPFLMCKYALPVMIEHGHGNIINIASVAGLVGTISRAAYCASKGAVVQLTRAMAVDHVKQGIRVNAICPGTVDSPWVGRLLDQVDDPAAARAALEARQPMGRLGTPEEVAQAALYLASDVSSFATGSMLVLDGGRTAQ